MFGYLCTFTDVGVIGLMPCGEERIFANEGDYAEAYHDEENEIIDQLYELNNGFYIEDDFNGWMR